MPILHVPAPHMSLTSTLKFSTFSDVHMCTQVLARAWEVRCALYMHELDVPATIYL